MSFSLIFTRSYLPIQNLGDSHPNTIAQASWLVHVLCNFKATWYQEAYFSVSWIHHRSTSCWYLYFTFLVKVLLPPFHYRLGSYLHLFFLIHFTKSKLIERLVTVLKLPEKNALFPLLGIYHKKSSICRKYKHKHICINITQLTAFYYYSATSSIINLSIK